LGELGILGETSREKERGRAQSAVLRPPPCVRSHTHTERDVVGGYWAGGVCHPFMGQLCHWAGRLAIAVLHLTQETKKHTQLYMYIATAIIDSLIAND